MWKELSENGEIKTLIEDSRNKPVLIFKHSTRCGISSMAKNRLERNWNDKDAESIQTCIIDLIRYRALSQAIADEFQVSHESPQVLLISQGQCIYNASHMGIDYRDIVEKVAV